MSSPPITTAESAAAFHRPAALDEAEVPSLVAGAAVLGRGLTPGVFVAEGFAEGFGDGFGDGFGEGLAEGVAEGALDGVGDGFGDRLGDGFVRSGPINACEWFPPANTPRTRYPPKPEIGTGLVAFLVVPLPICPSALSPQA
jgi:hypothetical protein